jgi:hypothetical protein
LEERSGKGSGLQPDTCCYLPFANLFVAPEIVSGWLYINQKTRYRVYHDGTAPTVLKTKTVDMTRGNIIIDVGYATDHNSTRRGRLGPNRFSKRPCLQ